MNNQGIQILVTGSRFTGRGFRAIEPVLEELINSAKEEIHIAAYVLTPSATHILSLLEGALIRGTRVTAIINNLEQQPQEIHSKLRLMADRFHHMKLSGFCSHEGGHLHAKVIVADRKVAVMGSANLTWGGLVANHELALLVSGDAAWHLASLIDSLMSS
jgi:phosphatidylserine/phosphatidylglycerophosphate/cardiolipin synthase-like enzyme